MKWFTLINCNWCVLLDIVYIFALIYIVAVNLNKVKSIIDSSLTI